MKKGRGNKTSAVEREQRVDKELKLLADGHSASEVREQLGISRPTLWRDLHKNAVELAKGNREAFVKLRSMQVGSLIDMAEQVATGEIPPEVATSWRGIMADVAKLLGLNSPSKSMHLVLNGQVHVQDPDITDSDLIAIMTRDFTRDQPQRVLPRSPRVDPNYH